MEVVSISTSFYIFDVDSQKHNSVLNSLKQVKVLDIAIQRPDPECKLKYLLQNVLSNDLPIEYIKICTPNIDDKTIEYISQIKTLRKLAFDCIEVGFQHDYIFILLIDYKLFEPENIMVDERYIVQLISNLPNIETMIFKTEYQIELISSNEIIRRIEKDLQTTIPSVPLHIDELKYTKNTFKDHYSAEIKREPGKWCGENYDISLTIREVNKIRKNHFSVN